MTGRAQVYSRQAGVACLPGIHLCPETKSTCQACQDHFQQVRSTPWPGPLQPGSLWPGPPRPGPSSQVHRSNVHQVHSSQVHQVHLRQVRPTVTGVHLQRVEARITTHSTWNAVQPLGSWAACRRAGWGSWIGDGSLKVGLPGYVGRHYAVLSRALLDPGDTPAPCPLNPLNPLTLFASSSVHLRGGSRSVRRSGGRSMHRGGGRSVRRQQYTMGDMAGRSSP